MQFVTYTYDVHGNMLTADNRSTETAFQYDYLNRVDREAQTIKYGYSDNLTFE